MPGRRSFSFDEDLRRAQHDRGVRVVAAGVLHAGVLALVGDVVPLLDGQGVEVGAHGHHRARPPALQDADDARLGHGMPDLEAEGAQALRHELARADLAVAQLGMAMDVAPGLDEGGSQGLRGGADLRVGGGGGGGGESETRPGRGAWDQDPISAGGPLDHFTAHTLSPSVELRLATGPFSPHFQPRTNG